MLQKTIRNDDFNGNFVILHVKVYINAEISRQN